MHVRGPLAALFLALAGAGCTSPEPERVDPSPSPSSIAASPTPSSTVGERPAGRTTELRLTLKPRNEAVVSVKLPQRKPGGTMVTWSAYLVGVGTGASATNPRKVECYVVQATGPAFADRVYYVADSSTLSAGTDVSISGSGLVDTREGRRLFFECELDDNSPEVIPGLQWKTLPGQPIQVTLTQVEYERRELTVT